MKNYKKIKRIPTAEEFENIRFNRRITIIQNVLNVVGCIGVAVSLALLIGYAGSLEQDQITLTEAVTESVKIIPWLLVSVLLVNA